MKVRKKINQPKVYIRTYYPSYFHGLLDFPGIYFINWDDTMMEGTGMKEFQIQCPNEDVASDLAKFVRSYFEVQK